MAVTIFLFASAFAALAFAYVVIRRFMKINDD